LIYTHNKTPFLFRAPAANSFPKFPDSSICAKRANQNLQLFVRHPTLSVPALST